MHRGWGRGGGRGRRGGGGQLARGYVGAVKDTLQPCEERP